VSFTYRFDWDPAKALANRERHDGIGFELAATVLRDPLAISVYDDTHSESEDRWITLGQAENGQLLVVVHTFDESDPSHVRVRLISARPATRRERAQYETRQP
jgi:uncharacterized protein